MELDVERNQESERDRQGERGEIFQPIVKENQASAEVEIENLLVALDRLILACGNQDVENFDKWIAKAIEANGNIMVNQVNDLPFLLPKRYQELPRMTGRAELKFTIKHDDESSFGNLNGKPLKKLWISRLPATVSMHQSLQEISWTR